MVHVPGIKQMDKAFITIVQKLIAEQGKDALLNAAKCKGLLADYTCGEYKKESRLLLQALEAGTAKAIASTTELQICKLQQIRYLQDEFFITQDIATGVVDLLELVLRGTNTKIAPDAPVAPLVGGNGRLFVSGSDVYVAGHQDWKAVYWKNGQAVRLSNSRSNAVSVFVSGSDIYAAGVEDRKAAYWKNGQLVWHLGTESAVNSIFVSGSDVFFAGDVGNVVGRKAFHGKNNQAVWLSNSEISTAWSIFVSGSDAYVAGGDDGKVVYWKNGQAVHLPGGQYGALSVFVTGSDVYVAGNGDDKVVYWKNGQTICLSNKSGGTSAIFVSGSDVYVAGYEDGKRTYWKNGKAVRLPNSDDITLDSIFVSGSDVYVAGHQDWKAVYWKNGGEIVRLG
jgi:hypothetical protein